MFRLTKKSTKRFLQNFYRCGLVGWCIECVFTGLGSLFAHKRDRRLFCQTSVWMFPIYGLAAFLPYVYRCIKKRCIVFRAVIYAVGILICEFFTGVFLKKFKACPWDYSKAKLNYKGVIRFDYLPCWALAGLLYEKLLCKK